MKQVLRNILLLAGTSLIFTLFFAGNVVADDEAMDEAELWAGVAEDIDEAPGYEDPKDTGREWTISLGVSAGVAPDYEGSNDYKFGYGPNLAASWRNLIFYRGKTLGVNLLSNKNLQAGPILARASGRSEDSNDKLNGLGDIDSSIEAGGFVSFRKDPFRFRLEARQDIDSGHEGALVQLSAGSTLPFENPMFLLMVGTTWASDDYMESFFGINETQSANSGLKSYKAKAGIKDIKIAMTVGYAITNRWRIGGAVEYKRLVGDAADSPIVDDENQFLTGISLSYHFGSKNLPEDIR